MHRLLYCLLGLFALSLSFSACDNGAPPSGSAVRNRDSLPMMVTYGVSKLISDSGVVRYKIVSEEWLVFDRTHPPRQEFRKGVLLQRYDDRLNVDLYITADTAYWYNQSLWELRGRVRVRNLSDRVTYTSEQLYWDNEKHEFYSHVPMHIVTPDRDLRGDRFRSDEHLTRYEVKRFHSDAQFPRQFACTGRHRGALINLVLHEAFRLSRMP